MGHCRGLHSLHRLFGCDGGVYFGAVGPLEGQSLVDLGFRQVIFCGDLGRRQSPLLSSHDDGLNADTCATQNGRWLSRRAAPVRDARESRIVETMAEGTYFFRYGPHDELIERDALVNSPLFCFHL